MSVKPTSLLPPRGVLHSNGFSLPLLCSTFPTFDFSNRIVILYVKNVYHMWSTEQHRMHKSNIHISYFRNRHFASVLSYREVYCQVMLHPFWKFIAVSVARHLTLDIVYITLRIYELSRCICMWVYLYLFNMNLYVPYYSVTTKCGLKVLLDAWSICQSQSLYRISHAKGHFLIA